MNQTFNGDVEAEISARATKMRANNTLKYNKVNIKIQHTECQRVPSLARHKQRQSPNERPEPGLRLRSPRSVSPSPGSGGAQPGRCSALGLWGAPSLAAVSPPARTALGCCKQKSFPFCWSGLTPTGREPRSRAGRPRTAKGAKTFYRFCTFSVRNCYGLTKQNIGNKQTNKQTSVAPLWFHVNSENGWKCDWRCWSASIVSWAQWGKRPRGGGSSGHRPPRKWGRRALLRSCWHTVVPCRGTGDRYARVFMAFRKPHFSIFRRIRG